MDEVVSMGEWPLGLVISFSWDDWTVGDIVEAIDRGDELLSNSRVDAVVDEEEGDAIPLSFGFPNIECEFWVEWCWVFWLGRVDKVWWPWGDMGEGDRLLGWLESDERWWVCGDIEEGNAEGGAEWISTDPAPLELKKKSWTIQFIEVAFDCMTFNIVQLYPATNYNVVKVISLLCIHVKSIEA